MKSNLTLFSLAALLLPLGAIAVTQSVATSRNIEAAPKYETTKGECGAVKNLYAIVSKPDDEGMSNVTLHFTTPTTYYENYEEKEGLDEIDYIEISQRNEDWDYDVIQTIQNPAVGVEMDVDLGTFSSGTVPFRVTAYNSASDPDYNYNGREYIYVYVGYDTPEQVANLKIVNNYPEVNVSWSAPTKGANNGYIDLNEIKYKVVRYIGSEATTVAEAQEDTTFSETLSLDKVSAVKYEVTPISEAGEGYSNVTETIVTGPAVALPFYESFPQGSPTNLWSSYASSYYITVDCYISTYGGKYTPFGEYMENGYDEDYGAVCFSGSSSSWADEQQCYASYTSSAISLEGAENPAVSLYNYRIVRADNAANVGLYIIQNGVENKVKEFTYTDGESGWQLEVINLKEFVGESPINIMFKMEGTNKQDAFAAFDCIKVDNLVEKDLMAGTLTLPATVRSGEEYTANFSVVNNGSQDSGAYSVVLYKDGEELSRQEETSLTSGSTKSFSFTNMADNSYAETSTFYAAVIYDEDQNPANNTSDKVKMAVEMAQLPAVPSLEGAYDENSNSVALTWNTPDYEVPDGILRTDDMESYSYPDTQFGDWAMYEDDAHYTFYLSTYGLNTAWDGDKMIYRVMDQSQLLYDPTTWFGKPHSGNKYLMSVGSSWSIREDWLCSPELSGKEQTLEFYAVSHHIPEDPYGDEGDVIKDQIFVYASFTGNAQEDFVMKCLTAPDDKSTGYELNNSLANGDDYEKISVDLPEGTTYFAIVVTNPGGKSIVFLDDITFEAKPQSVPLTLVGYNVYRDDEKINAELITGNSYTDTAVEPNKKYQYSIEAVYSIGNADRESFVTVDTTSSGIATLTKSNVSAVGLNGAISVTATANDKVMINDLSGKMIYNGKGSCHVNVSAGYYLVRIGTYSIKVLVK
jgi:hypothetical protein